MLWYERWIGSKTNTRRLVRFSSWSSKCHVEQAICVEWWEWRMMWLIRDLLISQLVWAQFQSTTWPLSSFTWWYARSCSTPNMIRYCGSATRDILNYKLHRGLFWFDKVERQMSKMCVVSLRKSQGWVHTPLIPEGDTKGVVLYHQIGGPLIGDQRSLGPKVSVQGKCWSWLNAQIDHLGFMHLGETAWGNLVSGNLNHLFLQNLF